MVFAPKPLHPKAAKEDLAAEMVTRYHGAEAAAAARQGFNAVFAGGSFPADAPEYACDAGEASTPAAFLEAAGLVRSRGEARRLVKEGALSVNGERVSDAAAPLAAGKYEVRLGKKRFLRLTVR